MAILKDSKPKTFLDSCKIEVLPELVRITIDDPLPNKDRVIIETSQSKAISLLGQSVAGSMIGNLGQKKFFGEE